MAKSRIRNQKKAKKVTRTRVQTRRNSQSKIRGKKQSKNRNVPRTKRARRRISRGGTDGDDEVQKGHLFSKFPQVVTKETTIIQLINDAVTEYYGPKYKNLIKINTTLAGFGDNVFISCEIKKSQTSRHSISKLLSRTNTQPQQISIRKGEAIITCKDTKYRITLEKNTQQNTYSYKQFNYVVIVEKEVKPKIWVEWYRFQPEFPAPPSEFSGNKSEPQGFVAKSIREGPRAVAAKVKENR